MGARAIVKICIYSDLLRKRSSFSLAIGCLCWRQLRLFIAVQYCTVIFGSRVSLLPVFSEDHEITQGSGNHLYYSRTLSFSSFCILLLPVIAKNTAKVLRNVLYTPEHGQQCRALKFCRCLSLLCEHRQCFEKSLSFWRTLSILSSFPVLSLLVMAKVTAKVQEIVLYFSTPQHCYARSCVRSKTWGESWPGANMKLMRAVAYFRKAQTKPHSTVWNGGWRKYWSLLCCNIYKSAGKGSPLALLKSTIMEYIYGMWKHTTYVKTQVITIIHLSCDISHGIQILEL